MKKMDIFDRMMSWIFRRYYRLKNYLFWGEMKKKHLIFKKEGNRIQIMIKGHEQFVAEKQVLINEFQKKRNENATIEYAFDQAVDGCNMIFFEKDRYGMGFWVKGKNIQLSISLHKRSGTTKYFYPLLGVLADMGFVRSDFAPSGLTISKPAPYYKYKVEKTLGGIDINGYFGRWTGGAADFTKTMFNEVFKAKKGVMKIEVE